MSGCLGILSGLRSDLAATTTPLTLNKARLRQKDFFEKVSMSCVTAVPTIPCFSGMLQSASAISFVDPLGSLLFISHFLYISDKTAMETARTPAIIMIISLLNFVSHAGSAQLQKTGSAVPHGHASASCGGRRLRGGAVHSDPTVWPHLHHHPQQCGL